MNDAGFFMFTYWRSNNGYYRSIQYYLVMLMTRQY